MVEAYVWRDGRERWSCSVIRFACRTCHERLAVPIRYAGRKGRCPACNGVNEVPTASEWPEPAVPATAVHPAPPTRLQPQQSSPRVATSQIAPPTGTQTPVPWSAPEAARPAPIPEVAPIFDDEPAPMVEMSAFDDAAGMSTLAKVLIAMAILAGIAGVIWGLSFLFIWSKGRGI
jgi:hypothetical protein